MQRLITVWFVALFATLGATRTVAHAKPLDVHRVPADAAGVAHLDVDALRRTSFYKPMKLAQAISGLGDSLQPIAEPLFDDCQSITLWFDPGHRVGKKDDRAAAFVIEFPQGSKRAGELIDAAVKLTHAKRTGTNRYSGKTDDDVLLELALVGNMVVAAEHAETLSKAIAALQGKTPAMTEKMLPGGSVGRGVFLFAALGPMLLDEVKQSASSKLLKSDILSLAFNLGETGTDVRASAVATMATADDAAKVKSVIDGLISLVALSSEVKLARPVESYVKTTVTGPKVELVVTMPTAELVKLLEDQSKHP